MKIKEQLYTQQEELRNERDSIADFYKFIKQDFDVVKDYEKKQESYDYDQDDANYHAQKDLEME